MLLTAEIKNFLLELEHAVQTNNHPRIEALVHSRFDTDLLSDDMLESARAMELSATVIFLATLGIYNLPEPNDRNSWLEIYNSLAKHQLTDEMLKASDDNPIKQMVLAIIESKNSKDYLANFVFSEKYKEHWVISCQLAFDHQKFEILHKLLLDIQEIKNYWDFSLKLKLVKSIVSRFPVHSKIRGVKPYSEVAKIYTIANNYLPDTPEFSELKTWFSLWIADAYWRNRQFDNALIWAKKTLGTFFEVRGLSIIGSVYAYQGEIEKSIQSVDQMIEHFIDEGSRNSIINQEELENPKDSTKPVYETEDAATALIDLKNTLEPYDIKPFLISGTLLGYARENKILNFDKDVDVGIMGWKDQYQLVVALLESGLFKFSTRTVQNSETYFLPIIHIPTNQHMDIMFFHDEGDCFHVAIQRVFGVNPKFRYSKFGLTEIEFLGVKFYAPDNIDQHLTENYGNWRIPDPNYLFIEAPSFDVSDHGQFQLNCRLFILDMVATNNTAKLRRTIDLLQKTMNQPYGISEKISCLLEKIYTDMVERNKILETENN